MLDPLLTLLAAKAKAVGLVAGTAMVTAALAGGGAVAMTAVSHDGTVHDEVVVEDVLDETTTPEDTSGAPTVTLEDPVAEEVEDVEEVEVVMDSDVPRPLPADFVCDDSKNHGQNVSAYARSLDKGPGRGEKVSAVAQSDCGKKAGDEQDAAEQETEAPDEEASVQSQDAEVDEPKAAKPEKSKAERTKPAKAEKAGKGSSAGKGKAAAKGKR